MIMILHQCLIHIRIRNYTCILKRHIKNIKHSTAGIIG